MSRGAAAIATMGLTMAGCSLEEINVPPTTSRVLVHAVLNTATREQTVLVERALTGAGDSFGSTNGGPEHGADVTIIAPGGLVLRGVEDVFGVRPEDNDLARSAAVYRVSLDRYGIDLIPGGEYTLRVRTTGGHEVTGTTIIPVVHEPARPMSTQVYNRDHDALHLDWPRAQYAKAYELDLQSPDGGKHKEFVAAPTTLEASLRGDFSSDVFVPGWRTTATLFALDSNYYDYYRTTNNPFTGTGLISRLHGGIGVFGAIAPVTVVAIDVEADIDDPREGSYVLASDGAPSDVPRELFLYVTNDGRNDVERYSGRYGAPDSGTPHQWVFGWKYGGAVVLNFMNGLTPFSQVMSIVGQWTGTSLVGEATMGTTTTRVTYTKR